MEEKKAKMRLVVRRDDYVEEIRCKQCDSLLFKARFPLLKSDSPVGIEVKCRRCGRLNCY